MPKLKKKKNIRKKSSNGLIRYIDDHWRGNLTLVQSFWVNGFLLNIVVALPLIYAEMSIDKISETLAIIFLVYFLLYFIYFVWVNIGIWRSSGSYISNKKKSSFWGYAARLAVILSVIRAVGQSVSSFLV